MTEQERELIALGRAIRRLRHARGLSMASLATKAGVSAKNLNRIELGQGNPTLTTLRPLADALGVMLSELFLAAEVEAADGGEA
ncbi:MAG: helix-turn-helix domain-containing protein [Solirubrobacterales bacterium]